MFTSKAAAQAKKADALKRLHAWEATRPKKPYYQQPKYVETSSMFFGAFYPFAGIGFIFGLFTTMSALVDGSGVLILTAMLWMPFVFGFGIPFGLIILIQIVGIPVYRYQTRIWKEYEIKLYEWRAIGQKEFAQYKNDWEIWSRVAWY
jgi:hypothetical protein